MRSCRPNADKAITIDVFIRPEELDPVYYTDRTYYLVPDGEVGRESYAVLRKVMADDGRYAMATMVLSGRAQVVLIRPVEKLLAVTVLSYETQLKKPADFADEVPDVAAGAAEVKLAKTLVEASTADEFDFGKYQDQYTENVRKLIESKTAGKKIVSGRDDGEPAIINLMDALRESLHEAKATGRHSAATVGLRLVTRSSIEPAEGGKQVRAGPRRWFRARS